jgi:catabolite regulation protein CreA
LNSDGALAAPYLPQESCWLSAFERSIGLQGAELPLAFDVDEAAISCGNMFFPM